MLGHLGQIGHTFAAPGADFKVILYSIVFGQSPKQGDVDGHRCTRKVGVWLSNFFKIREKLVDFDDRQTVFEAVFADDILLVAAFVLQDEVEQIRMADDAPDGFGEFIQFVHFQQVVSRIVVSVRRCSSESLPW